MNTPTPEMPVQSVTPMPEMPKAGHGKVIALVVVGVLLLAGLAFAWFNRAPAPVASTSVTPSATVAPDPNAVTVWSWNTAAKALKELVPAFNKIYPNIPVNVVEIPYAEANDKFRLAMSTGTGFPDVMDTENSSTSEYIKSGYLTDITDLASKYHDAFVAYKWTEVTQDSRIYALPWDSAPAGLFYRRDLLEAAGVNPDTIKTWDDFIAAGKKVTRDTNGDGKPDQFMVLMSHQADVGDTFLILLAQWGGTLFDEKGLPAFNSSAGVGAVNLMKKIFDVGIAANIGLWSPEMYAAIKNGTIASIPSGVWFGGQIETTATDTAGKWGIMGLPAVTSGGVRTAIRGGSNLAISAKSTRKDAAWKFIEFALANKDSQLQMYKTYTIFPALKSAYSDPAFKQPSTFFGGQNTSQLFIDLQSTIPSTFHYGTHFNTVANLVSAEIIKVINGQKTVQQALADAQQQALTEIGVASPTPVR